MEDLIRSYEESRAALSMRIAMLREQLRSDTTLRQMEIDAIKARIAILSQERTELLHDIREMLAHTRQHIRERNALFVKVNLGKKIG